MKKYMPILKDGLILIVVSTVFVTVVNQSFKGLKKSADADPIVTAVQQDKLETIQGILSQQGYEAEPGGFATLELYLKDRANRRDEFGRTPLMRAAHVNFSDAKMVLDADSKRVAIAEYLATNGADLNAVDTDGWTALMWASWSGLSQVSAKLLQIGADVAIADAKGNTALMIAAQRGHVELVKALLEKGADKTVRAAGGKSAYEFAVEGKAQYGEKAAQYDGILELLQAPAAQQGQG